MAIKLRLPKKGLRREEWSTYFSKIQNSAQWNTNSPHIHMRFWSLAQIWDSAVSQQRPIDSISQGMRAINWSEWGRSANIADLWQFNSVWNMSWQCSLKLMKVSQIWFGFKLLDQTSQWWACGEWALRHGINGGVSNMICHCLVKLNH